MSGWNIYRRKDGRLEGRVPLEKDAAGKRRYRAFFGYSKEDLIGKMMAFRQSLMAKEPLHVTFSEFFQEWYGAINQRVKESTAANYWMKGQKHLLPFFGEMRISGIESNDIYGFIECKRREGLSERYIADNLTLLKAVFKYAVRRHHIPNPMDDVVFKRSRSASILVFDAEQKRQLTQYLAKDCDKTALGIRICLATGLRIGELCALRWEDVDLEKRILTVRHTVQRIQTHQLQQRTKLIMTEPKSESSYRCIPIPDALATLLRKHCGAPQEFVLSGTKRPVEPRVMQYRFSKILKNAKLPSIHFHALRHMFASDCIRLGCDMKSLSEMLGHSGVEITMNLYVHSSFEQKRQFMERLSLNF